MLYTSFKRNALESISNKFEHINGVNLLYTIRNRFFFIIHSKINKMKIHKIEKMMKRVVLDFLIYAIPRPSL